MNLTRSNIRNQTCKFHLTCSYVFDTIDDCYALNIAEKGFNDISISSIFTSKCNIFKEKLFEKCLYCAMNCVF